MAIVAHPPYVVTTRIATCRGLCYSLENLILRGVMLLAGGECHPTGEPGEPRLSRVGLDAWLFFWSLGWATDEP
jgi:hypothetical protein